MSKAKIAELTEEINNYVEMFNTICKQLGEHLLSKFPKNRDIHIYNDVVSDVIKKKPVETISIFIKQIYANDAYRVSILESDEKFFRHNDHSELTKGDKDSVGILTQLQSCWDNLNGESKHYIMEAMNTLIEVCDSYVENKDELNKLKKAKA
jgi:hypothetical protein